MLSLHARTTVRIFGTRNAWSLAANGRSEADGRNVLVSLEIQGSPRNGYHLVMSPDGFFTADSHYDTLDEALDAGSELFGVAHDGWSSNAR
jgi:hypothetical protein